MRDYLKFYIDGSWVDAVTPRTLDVINPASETVAGRISLGSAADVDAAVGAARKSFARFSTTSRSERIELLESILSAYRVRQADLAAAVTEEMGAPGWLANAAQVPLGASHLSIAIEALKNYPFEEARGSTLLVREAIGVSGFITPWNWPLSQILSKVAPALAVGCTIVLKPSEMAPFSACLFAEIVDAAGAPPGVFNLVNGDGAGVGAAIAAHPDIDVVSFTGSTRAGDRGRPRGRADDQTRAAGTWRQVAQHHSGRRGYRARRDGRRRADDAEFGAVLQCAEPHACSSALDG